MINNIFVLAVLHVDDDVLLLQRNDQQAFGAGLYSLPGGKVESGERALQAIQREVKEELDLDLEESDFTLLHTLHRKGTESEFIALCFEADITDMEPRNNEPDKCENVEFFNVDELPDDMIPAHKQILEGIKHEINYSEHGWD